MTDLLQFPFENTYADQLTGCYTSWTGDIVPNPQIALFNHDLARELGLDAATFNSEEGARVLTGGLIPNTSKPLAMAYAGHQFGNFSPKLGDGRALLLGEIVSEDGRFDLHLKGSGKTPFSRGGDGKAVLAPVLREYIMGEAMHALNIPTTRALAACTTGQQIMRQNGPEPGAVLARIASSHLRVGTFQFFAARRETDKVRQLADYAIARHDPDLANQDDQYLQFLMRVSERQAKLLAKWMSVGFVHGVMNTDNMTISGETIDYGPCAFMDAYDPQTVFSSIDRMRRYAYGRQPQMAQWNLARLAESLLDLIAPGDPDRAIQLAGDVVNGFMAQHLQFWQTLIRRKCGLQHQDSGDRDLLADLFQLLDGANVDYTGFFRTLPDAKQTCDRFADPSEIRAWHVRWRARLQAEARAETAIFTDMDSVNPIYIPRNHMVEQTLQAATESNDLADVSTLLSVLSKPFTKRADFEEYAQPAPQGMPAYQTFCGT
nr:YdiU family protein [Halocynthiibacter namhaensis]